MTLNHNREDLHHLPGPPSTKRMKTMMMVQVHQFFRFVPKDDGAMANPLMASLVNKRSAEF